MRRLVAALAAVAVGCSPGAGSGAATTVPAPVVTTTVPATTTVPEQPYEIQGCAAPPVTFSALCEVYQLIQERHVDAPVDAAELAALALQGLGEFETEETEPPPRTLFCALPDAAFVDLCAELARRIEESRVPVAEAMEAAVGAMAGLGLDAFTYYLGPGQAGSLRDGGVVGGVGVLLDATDSVGSRCLRVSDTCPLVIVFVLEDNPGEAAGLQAGDRIVSIDGTPVDGAGFAAAAAAIAGDETGTVDLAVERDGQMLDIAVQRATLNVPGVEVDLPIPGVGYLRIPDFDSDIPSLTEEALRLLLEHPVDTIVVDLRDNPGGRIDSVVEVASMFIGQGAVFTATSPTENIDATVTADAFATGQRLVVLVNRGTASSAEILAGALKEARGAVLVGSATFGKDAVQIPFELRNGGELHLTVARWRTPAGATAGEGGLAPDRELDFAGYATVEEVVGAALDAAS